MCVCVIFATRNHKQWKNNNEKIHQLCSDKKKAIYTNQQLIRLFPVLLWMLCIGPIDGSTKVDENFYIRITPNVLKNTPRPFKQFVFVLITIWIWLECPFIPTMTLSIPLQFPRIISQLIVIFKSKFVCKTSWSHIYVIIMVYQINIRK